MITKSFKTVMFTLLIGSVIYLASCEKQKITYKNTPAPEAVILPPQCEACHNGTFPEHSTNAHSKHTTGLYTFACSTCHFERGDGTAYHMNSTKDINFNLHGLATRKGADSNTPTFDPSTKTCSNIYCHSNGVTADRGTDGTYTWATTAPPFGTIVYTTTPRWDTGKITACTYCHNGKGNMTSPYLISRPDTMVQGDYPASGQHQLSMHNSNSQDFSGVPYASPFWVGVQCFWCHNPSTASPNDSVMVIDGPILQGTYGTSKHVDGETFFKPRNISAGGTMANGLSYSGNGTEAHCGVGTHKCWGN